MHPDLGLLSTLIGWKYPCLELFFMVPKVFEPLKFDCILLDLRSTLRYQFEILRADCSFNADIFMACMDTRNIRVNRKKSDQIA